MEMNAGTNSATGGATRRIHPLMAAAAVAVIVASITAVAAMTGLMPKSQGTANEPVSTTAPVSTAASEPAPATRQPLVAQEPAKPAKRTVARTSPKTAEPTQVAAASVPPPAAAPAPRNFGTVESVRTITQAGEGTGLGAVAGGVLGAVLGHQVGNGTGRTVMTAAGAAGGAYAGHQIEKHKRGTKRWEIGVRMEDGTLRTISTDAEPTWRTGDRVRVVSGTLQPA